MRARPRLAVVLGTYFVMLLARAFALDPSLDISQYAHTSWKVRDGFTKGSITSLAQTPDGYLWLGTEFGLLRFDGVRAVPWQPPGSQQLPSNYICKLLATRDGTLWIGTRKGLASWNHGKLRVYAETAQQLVGQMLEGRDGTIWAGTVTNPAPARICAIWVGSIQCGGSDGTLGYGVLGLYEDANGNLWAGAQKGFWRWKPGPAEFFPMESTNGIRAFAEGDDTSILIGGTGLYRFVGGHTESYSPAGSVKGSAIMRMIRDHDGGLWIGTLDRGLVHVRNGKTDTFDEADGLSGDVVEAICEDREGNIWVATADGLDRFRAYAVRNLSIKQGLSNGFSVLTATNGAVWMSTVRGLKRWEDGQIYTFGSHNGSQKSDGMINGQFPGSLFEDSTGRIWVATLRGFGYLQDDQFVAVIKISYGEVTSVTESPQGHLWIVDYKAGLFHLFQNRVVQQIPWAGLGHTDYARVVVSDPAHGGLWLGFSRGGISYFVDGALRASYSTADGLGEGKVDGLRFGQRGALWIATEHGLSRFKDGHVATLTSRNGLPCDAVHWTMEDDEHAFWLYMPCGLARIDGAELDAWAADPGKTIKAVVFDASDGVRSHSDAGSISPLVGKSPDGKLWFTTWDGVSVIDPHHLPFNKIPPSVHIENITADDKPVEVSNGMHLPTGVRHLDIDYTALSLVVPEKVRFRVKLEGEDKEWRELVNVRHVEYTNLPPKHYRFRVLACNNSGVWNETGDTLEFVIPPMWYQTNWFFSLCAAAFLALLWAAYEFRVRQLAARFNLRLEERVGERTRIARELHDTLLQSFHGLLLQLQSVLQLLPQRPLDARQRLENTIDDAAAAITEARDAVQGLRSSTITTNELTRTLKTLGEELAHNEANPTFPRFSVEVFGSPRELHPIIRDEVYRVASEALRNAFIHAHAQQIEVELRYEDGRLLLAIRDDGKGIDPEVLAGKAGHYGLPGMHERAKLVAGKLDVWSELNAGTEIELTVPAANAYMRAVQRKWWPLRFSRKGKEQEVKTGS